MVKLLSERHNLSVYFFQNTYVMLYRLFIVQCLESHTFLLPVFCELCFFFKFYVVWLPMLT